VDDPLLTEDARGLVADLTIRKQSVATAESLTAGLLAATLAGVPGASEVLRGGLVTYTEHMKIVLAGVAQRFSRRSDLSRPRLPERWPSVHVNAAKRPGASG